MTLLNLTILIYLILQINPISSQNHAPVPPLTFAAAFGNLSEVDRLLRDGSFVDEPDFSGQTALHMASLFGRIEACKLLLDANANPNAETYNRSDTPLLYAAQFGSLPVFELLLHFGANLSAVSNNPETAGNTPLLNAIQFRTSPEAIIWLLDHGADITAQNIQGQTCLHLAVIDGNFKVVEMLLRRGAIVDARDGNGKTPLNWLAGWYQPQIPLFDLLLRHGADVNAKNNAGHTPLDEAKTRNHYPVILFLLQHGAKTKLPMDPFPYISDLSFAAAYGDFQKIDAILAKYGKQSGFVNQRDWLNQTALHSAAMFGQSEAVRSLLLWKPDLEALDTVGLTALHYGAKRGDFKTVKLLIEAGSNLEANSQLWGTPLSYAVRFSPGTPETTEILLESGAQANTIDEEIGYAALHWAVQAQSLANIQLLIDYKADVNLKTKLGVSPLSMIFAYYGVDPQITVVHFLLNNGVDINSNDNDNCTALCWGRRSQKRPEVRQYLVDNGAIDDN